MSLNVEFLEEGEIESDADDLSKCRKSTSASDMRENGHERVIEDAPRSEEKERSLRRSRRKRRRDSRERSGSREKAKSSQPIDPVEIAEMDEYEMLCIRGASPPKGASFCTMEDAYQPVPENKSTSAFYEYERDYRYDSDDDNYSKRRGSPPSKRRRERCRRRHRQNKRPSPDRRERRRRSNSVDESEIREGRKMEICKFYLLDCCVKRSICKYMHSEFPCKYFHLGLECQHEKPCKFSHGKALSEEMTQALARHVAAAPKAILGDFKRYSRDRALVMIQAKNLQLSGANRSVEKDSLPNEKESKNKSTASSCSKPLTQSQRDISAIFSKQQMEKITALGITSLQQITQMSLAQLIDIGLSLNQIGEIQKIAANEEMHLNQPLALLCKSEDEGVEENTPKGDMDMRQLLPMLPTFDISHNSTENISSGTDSNYNTEEERSLSISPNKNKKQVDPLAGPMKNDNNQTTVESSFSFMDDEPELVIDESIDNNEEQLESENKKTEAVAWDSLSNSISSGWDNELSENQSENRSPTSSDEALFDSISFDEPFEPINFYAESKNDRHENAKSKNTGKSKKPEKGPVLSDFDMRLPFADVIANYVPAMEIDASIRSHLGINYKLIEIIIPEKKDPILQPEKIPENTLDPRLKKLLNKTTKKESSDLKLRVDKKSKMSFVNPYKLETQQSEVSVDPRKRKESISDTHVKSIQQNFNYVLNTFLQKSKWYQNLNSKLKIEINQHLADLTTELNKFSQISSRDKQFQLSTINNAAKISEILQEIGLEINKDGIIQEYKKPARSESKEYNIFPAGDGFPNEIPSLLNMGMNQNYPIPNSTFPPPNNQILSNNLIPNMPTLPHQRFEFPKPGLLGIAPGIETPRHYLHQQSNGQNYNNNINPLVWNEPPPNYMVPSIIPKIRPGIDELNRNPFGMKTGKRWNRIPALKKPRRI